MQNPNQLEDGQKLVTSPELTTFLVKWII